MRGVAYARQFARRIFQRLGAEDHTRYDPDDSGYVTYEGEGYVIRGGNHLAGTHIMGTEPGDSVVDADQRSWDHENLYLVGGGSMPSIGTSNITLTLAALCFRSAEHIIEQLDARTAAAHELPDGGGRGRCPAPRSRRVERAAPLPVRGAAARARDDPAVPDGALLDPSRHQLRRLPRASGSSRSRRCCTSRWPPTSSTRSAGRRT